MFRTRMTGLLLAALLALPAIAQQQPEIPAELPDNVSELRSLAGQAYITRNHDQFRRILEKLHRLRPYNSEYMYQLVLARALQGDRSAAYEMMLTMQRQGLSYDFDQTPSSEAIRGTQVYEYINDLMKRAGQPMGDGEVAFELPAEMVLPEALTWDPTREAFLVGTVNEGILLSVTPAGERTELLRANADNGMWGIFDVAVDSERNRLWITSASTPVFAGHDEDNSGEAALFEFELDSLDFVKAHPVPEDNRPNALANMVLMPNGDLFIADAALPVIYRKTAGADGLEAFLAARRSVSLRGITASDDGRYLYLADYELGIVVIDLVDQKVYDLGGPETLNLGGIDGLYWWDGHLVMIQNGIEPERILRLELGEDGRTVTNIRPLAVALPEFDQPTYGTIVDGDLYYYANSHWSVPPHQRGGIRVMKTGLDSGADIIPPDLEAARERLGLPARTQKPASAEGDD